MEITSISPTNAVDQIALARAAAEAAAAIEVVREPSVAVPAPGALPDADTDPMLRNSFAERILGQATTSEPSAAAQAPGADIDKGAEAGTAQTFARAPLPVAEQPRPADTALPSAQHAKSEFAVPSSLLVPVTLVGLQVEPATGWPLQPQVALPASARTRVDSDESSPRRQDDDTEDLAQEDVEPDADERRPPTRGDSACTILFTDADEAAWCESLTRALRVALAARIPPRALLIAAEQWQRGRCVVLACPQGDDPAGPAWAFVLWPRRSAHARVGEKAGERAAEKSGAHATRSLTLFGVRVEARLHWSALPPNRPWHQVRVIKEHHPQRGRQLIATVNAESTGPLQCDVQLGPVAARSPRCCEVCVRIDAAQRFWAALGSQWSMHVIVSSQPLLSERPCQENTR